MSKRILFISLLLVLSTLMGCATPTQMAFQDESYVLTKKSKPVYLMTANIRNLYKTSYQPKLLVVNVEKSVVNGSEDRLNFTMDDKAKNESDDPNRGSNYLLRMELDSGDYVLRGLTSISGIFPIRGFFFTPLHESINVNGPGIYYLGHVSATVRERVGEEFKAGSTIPLIDQAVAGASGGTFDIEIIDRWDKDEPMFREKFAALKNVDIKKSILPPFNRQRAQKWWEDN